MTSTSVVLAGIFCSLCVYLFVTAPPELPDVNAAVKQGKSVDISNVFNAVNAINDTARRIYTKRIVGDGKERGLEFGEDWAEPSVDKGPLPALFTRMVASRMETKPSPLGLYLGSDQPINKSNLFKGPQAIGFAQLKETLSSVFIRLEDVGFVAMYPDVASAEPCISCHNEHPDSPKNDWIMNDVMGATTWTYPTEFVSSDEYLALIESFYDSVRESYQIYLDKAEGFENKVIILDDWPDKQELSLPDANTFIRTVKSESAAMVLNDLLLDASGDFENFEPQSTNE